ncbi:MAG: hypothetical protein JWM11_5290 [Planctomycetaceae bacterium]|nr:hypothetical protein [Planctomycetaceae bacterium]
MKVKLFVLLSILSLVGSETLCAAENGQIAGQLLDADGQITYAGEVVVFLCDAKTGYPIHRETKKSVEASFQDLSCDKFWQAVTDEAGSFEFNEVPVGNYRLVAQSWSGTKGMPKFPGKTSSFVILHGVAENVSVKESERTVASPRQLGHEILQITNDPPEASAFLLISLKPTLGDGILGPYGWGNEFTSQLIGVTHMAQPHVTIIGLPDNRNVHVALFNYDNNPGVGAATFKPGQQHGKLRIIASWSNGHHEPPPELKELTDHLQTKKSTAQEFLDGSGNKVRTEQEAQLKLIQLVRENPKREVNVAGLGQRRLADVIAALGYVKLRAQLRK